MKTYTRDQSWVDDMERIREDEAVLAAKFQNLFGLGLILQCIDGDLSWMDRDQPPVYLEHDRRWIFLVGRSAQHGVQIRDNLTDIVFQVGKAVERLKMRVTFWLEHFFFISG